MPVTSGLDLVAGPREVRAADRPAPTGDAADPGSFEAALTSILDGAPTSAAGDGKTDPRIRRLVDVATAGTGSSPDALALAAQPVPMPSPIPTETSPAQGAAPTADAVTDAVTTDDATAVGATAVGDLGVSGTRVTDASTSIAEARSEPRRGMTFSSPRGEDVTSLPETAQHALPPEATTLPDTGRRQLQPDTTKVPDLTTLPDTGHHALPPDATTLPDDFREVLATRVGTSPDVISLPDIARHADRTVVTNLPDVGRSALQNIPPTAPAHPTSDIGRGPTFGSVADASDVENQSKSTDDPTPRASASSAAVDHNATSEPTRQAPSSVRPLESLATAVPVATRLPAVAETRALVSSPAERSAVAEQLVSVVRPLAGSNGSHTMTLDLHPADLGRVRLVITVEGAMVHVAVHAEQATTSALLHQTMPELRRSLDAAGLTTGRIGLDSEASTSGGHAGDLRNPQAGLPTDLTGNQNQSGQERRRPPGSGDSDGHGPGARSYLRPVRSSMPAAVATEASRRRSVDVLL